MEQIALVILLIIGVPLCAGIWLIARAIADRERINELTQRVTELGLELAKLKKSAADQPESTEEQNHAYTTATLPPRREATQEPNAPLLQPPEPPPVPVFAPEFPLGAKPEPFIPPPLVEPLVSKVPEIAQPLPAPEPVTAKTPAPLPPLIVPALPALPPPIPKPVPPKVGLPKVAAPEPVFESARVTIPPRPAMPPGDAPTAPEKASFEMRLGTFWLVRIGIVMLLAGFAFFANYAYQNIIGKLGPMGKTLLLYLASGLLLGAGAWWQRRNEKPSLKNYAQVLFAGGLAAVYFTTYAAYHVPQLRIIPTPLMDGTLLFVWAGVIAWIADRRKSEVMALFAVGLAFFTSVITRVGEFTLYSNLILTITAVVFLVRNRWAGLSFASLITSYVGYAFWRFLHEDGWRWATPDENLWLGASFLAGYWLVFTTATFLSRSKNLSGVNRAAFLTLNNGAFFSLFLLTMLQVHSGGFWKFSLVYGSVLLALAACARQFLGAEPFAKNSYLTQGLLLVTLGFITRFSGMQLALVLGAESVTLFVLGSQRQSYVLKFFAGAAALLATGWCAVSLKAFDTPGLWTGAGVGAMLAFNAFWSHRLESKATPEPNRLECSFFALLAFAAWSMAAWFNTAEPHLLVSVVLAVESAVFFNILGGHKIAVPKMIAFASAACAIGWCIAGMKPLDTTGLWMGIGAGAILMLNTLRAHHQGKDSLQLFRAEPTAFTLLALASWLATTWQNTSEAHLPLVLAAEAVVLTFSIYWLRVREITLLGQSFLVFAQSMWLFHFYGSSPPWWSPATIIAVTIGLSHWWQHQKVLAIARSFYTSCSSMFALAAVAVVFVWLHPLVSPPVWLALTSLLAVAITAYGLFTRAWALAICGQIFLAVSAGEFLQQLFTNRPEWYFALAPMVVLAALAFATMAWFARQPDSKSEIRAPLLQVAMVYRWLALAMSLLWIWDYVPERQRVWAYMLAAVVMFGLARWKAAREALAATLVYAVAALVLLWARDGFVMDIYWANLLSLLALLVTQQLLRRAADQLPLPENAHGAVVIIAGVSLWRFVSCWISLVTSGFFVTMTWAGYALIFFAAGILLRERFYRWFGLSVLASAIGRVVVVDVWKQETIVRVLTFMALGVALLVIGFIYNRYQEKIRQWL